MFKLFRRAPTVSAWMDRHLSSVEEQVASGERKKTTLYNARALCRHIAKHIGDMRMDRIKPPDIMRVVRAMQGQGLFTSAQRACILLRRLSYEAIEEGVVPADCNPARAVRVPRASVQRNRLSLDAWREMLDVASRSQYPYIYRAMLLAVVAGQRRGDIARMRFEQITDGYLRVEQQKTGARVAIPLALRCEAIGWSLADVVDLCRDGNSSQYLLRPAQKDFGRHINPTLLSVRFCGLRKTVLGPWKGEGTPPTFHEQRSLSERLYAEQGIDTRKLLGHRRQSMTDAYNSDRRLREWVTVPF